MPDAPVNVDRTISDDGLHFIAGFEGFRASVYKDAVGKDTIGFGHLVKPKESFPGPITRDEALALLRKDAAIAESAVRAGVHVPLSQHQFDALASFVYNVGGGNFRTSTLLKKINAGDTAGAAAEFLRWNKAGGKVLNGLTRRRTAERTMFLTDDSPATTV